MSAELPPLPDASALEAALDRMVAWVAATFPLAAGAQTLPVHLVAIANGGIPLAEALAARLPASPTSLGLVNTLFFRDKRDLALHVANFQPTRLDFAVDDATVLLIDDVFATGRTARAALEELFAYGRPAEVRLATWADVQQKALPFAPDFVGLTLPTPAPHQIKLTLDPTPAAQHRATWKHR